jgi:hypothetical protein
MVTTTSCISIHGDGALMASLIFAEARPTMLNLIIRRSGALRNTNGAKTGMIMHNE